MKKTILNFIINEEAKWKKGRFEIENLQILGDSINAFDVEYNNICLFLDDKKYDETLKTWPGNRVSTDFIFYSTFNSYIRNSKEFSYSEEWNKVFSKIKNSNEEKDGILTKFIQMSKSYKYIYNLDFAVSGVSFYYSDSETFLMIADTGRIVTDINEFFMNGMYETICDVIKGKNKIIYKGEFNSDDELLKKCGGEEGFLKEFDNYK